MQLQKRPSAQLDCTGIALRDWLCLQGTLGTCPTVSTNPAVDPAVALSQSHAGAGWLPGGAFCEITCDVGYHPVGRATSAAGSTTSASQSFAEAPQFVICGMEGQLMGVTTCERNTEGHTCASAPCVNGGTCMEWKHTGYECRCPPGFNGQQCERTCALVCDDPPAGTAAAAGDNDGDGEDDSCAYDCEHHACDSAPCGVHGDFCMPLRVAPWRRCVCKKGWVGDQCDQGSVAVAIGAPTTATPQSASRPPPPSTSVTAPAAVAGASAPPVPGAGGGGLSPAWGGLVLLCLACVVWRRFCGESDHSRKTGKQSYSLVPQRENHKA